MTKKSKIFGTINNGLKKVEIVAESDLDFIIVHNNGWKMKRCVEVGMHTSYTFFREVGDEEKCLFMDKVQVKLWTCDTKLGELL